MAYEEAVGARVEALPDRPGVYLFRDQEQRVIYVGKAGSLRRRVRSYFTGSRSREPRLEMLVSRIRDLEYIVTDSEIQALILECNLIKRHRPRYNVNLKDDKQYPYLKITAEEFPRLLVTRRVSRDGGRYYGPFTDAGALHETARLLKQMFRLRSCREKAWRRRQRPCLNHYMGRCSAPCTGLISREEYKKMLDDVRQVLEGRGERLRQRLQEDMQAAAQQWRYEKAARLRDQIDALDRVLERQRLPQAPRRDHDVVAFARVQDDACFQVFFVRQGKLVGRDRRFLDGVGAMPEPLLVDSFLKQYYTGAADLPPEILVSRVPEEKELLQEWLSRQRGSRVGLRVPLRGGSVCIMEMVEENARWALEEYRQGERRRQERARLGLEDLARELGLDQCPERMEGYDISNLQGRDAVGVRVVFRQGLPAPAEYRRYAIAGVSGSDDCAMLAEVLRRRFRGDGGPEEDPGPWPQLVLVDGGRGQVETARRVMAESRISGVSVLGLAKQREEIYLPGDKQPLRLSGDRPGLQLLQHLRDEAHRFAVAYHRQLRGKSSLRSVLDDIPGVGPRRRQELLRRFGGLGELSQATVEELCRVPGMNRQAARAVAAFFQGLPEGEAAGQEAGAPPPGPG